MSGRLEKIRNENWSQVPGKGSVLWQRDQGVAVRRIDLRKRRNQISDISANTKKSRAARVDCDVQRLGHRGGTTASRSVKRETLRENSDLLANFLNNGWLLDVFEDERDQRRQLRAFPLQRRSRTSRYCGTSGNAFPLGLNGGF